MTVPTQIQDLLEHCRYEVCEWKSRDALVSQGVQSDALYVLIDGTASVWRELGDRTSFLDRVRPGDAFGEVSFLAPGTATATVRAETDCVALRVRHADLASLWNASPRVASAVHAWALQIVAGRLREATCELDTRIPTPTEEASWTSPAV